MVERLHAQSAARSRAWGRSVVAPLGADEDDEVLGLTPRCGTPATRRQRAEDSSGGGGGGGGGGSDGEMPVVPARNVAASSLQGIGVHAPGEEVREGPAPSPQAWSRSMGRSARQSLAAAAQPSLAQWSASLQAACSGEGDEEGSVGAGAILASSLPALESLLRELGRALQSCVAGLARMAAGGAVASPGALRGEAERALSVACCLACHTGSLSLLCPTRAADAASAAVAVAAGEDEHPPLPPPPDLLAKPAVTARQLLMELPPFAREKERGSARIRAFTQELAATRVSGGVCTDPACWRRLTRSSLLISTPSLHCSGRLARCGRCGCRSGRRRGRRWRVRRGRRPRLRGGHSRGGRTSTAEWSRYVRAPGVAAG